MSKANTNKESESSFASTVKITLESLYPLYEEHKNTSGEVQIPVRCYIDLLKSTHGEDRKLPTSWVDTMLEVKSEAFDFDFSCIGLISIKRKEKNSEKHPKRKR